jgi:hypothetical protein
MVLNMVDSRVVSVDLENSATHHHRNRNRNRNHRQSPEREEREEVETHAPLRCNDALTGIQRRATERAIEVEVLEPAVKAVLVEHVAAR